MVKITEAATREFPTKVYSWLLLAQTPICSLIKLSYWKSSVDSEAREYMSTINSSRPSSFPASPKRPSASYERGAQYSVGRDPRT
jgi:hypothetical protein